MNAHGERVEPRGWYLLLIGLFCLAAVFFETSQDWFYVLLLIYIGVSLERFSRLRRDEGYASPGFIFIASMFIAYPLKLFFYPLFSIEGMWYSQQEIYLAFSVFILSYLSFLAGLSLVPGNNKAGARMSPQAEDPVSGPPLGISLNVILLSFAAVVFLGVFSRFYLEYDVVGFEGGVSPYRLYGTLMLFFQMSFMIVGGICVYASLRAGKKVHLLLSQLLLFAGALSLGLGLKKLGFAQAVGVNLVVYLVLKDQKKKVRSAFFFVSLCWLLLFVVFFPAVESFRQEEWSRVEFGGLGAAGRLLEEAGNTLSTLSGETIGDIIILIWGRFSGLDILVPIVAYGVHHPLLDFSAFVRSFFQPEEVIDPGGFYKLMIVGMPASQYGGFGATLLGDFYVYGQTLGAMLGMFLWGLVNSVIYRLAGLIKRISPELHAGVLAAYLIWFSNVTLNGGLFHLGYKELAAFMVGSVFWMCVLIIFWGQGISARRA